MYFEILNKVSKKYKKEEPESLPIFETYVTECIDRFKSREVNALLVQFHEANVVVTKYLEHRVPKESANKKKEEEKALRKKNKPRKHKRRKLIDEESFEIEEEPLHIKTEME